MEEEIQIHNDTQDVTSKRFGKLETHVQCSEILMINLQNALDIVRDGQETNDARSASHLRNNRTNARHVESSRDVQQDSSEEELKMQSHPGSNRDSRQHDNDVQVEFPSFNGQIDIKEFSDWESAIGK